MHVTLVGGFDQRVPSAGGVRPYVESLGRYLDGVGVPRLTVLSSDRQEIGKGWCSVPVRRSGSTVHLLSSLCVNLRALPIPEDSVIHAQRPDDLLPFFLGGIGSAWVCTLHGNPFEGMRQTRSSLSFAVYATLESALLRGTERVIFVDPGSASEYYVRYPWLSGRAEVIPNAIDTGFFRPMNRSDQKQAWQFRGTTFLYAGRLEPEKRVNEIVTAFRELNRTDTTLVVAGDGRQREIVEREALGLNVRMLGSVSRSAMPSLMNAADALILYSTREGLPSAALEALACGTPVIATPVGALPDLIRNGENGILVTSRGELTKAMNSVCRGDPAASSSVPKTVESYSWHQLGPKVVRNYEIALGHSRERAPR